MLQNLINFGSISENLTYTKKSHKIQYPSTFKYHPILIDYKQSQLNIIGFLSII